MDLCHEVALFSFNSISLVYQFQHFDSVVVMWSHRLVVHAEDYAKPTTLPKTRPDHNTGNSIP